METKKFILKKIGTYLLLTFGLSSIFYYLIISSGSLRAGGFLYVLGLMWSPGTAGMLTQLMYQKNLRGLGWGWGKTKYQLWSYFIPLLYAAAAYGVVWLSGLGGFYNHEFIEKTAAQFGLQSFSRSSIIAMYVGFAATLGFLQSCISALGEEIGWRGFLVPHLAKIMSFRSVVLVSAGIWSVWHYPVLFFADYNAGTPWWYSGTCFTVMVFGISFVFAWMRLKSGSLWTGMILHASHNLFIQAVFDKLTVDTGITKYITGEFGAALVVSSLVVAWIVWKKKNDLESSPVGQSSQTISRA